MPLGLFITNLGGLGGPLAMGDTGGSVVIEDYYWEIHPTAGDGNLTPLLRGTVIAGIHDTWDLKDADIHYEPKTTATVSDEGYWDIGNAASATDTDYIRPLDV